MMGVSVMQRKWINVFILYPTGPNFQNMMKSVYSDP